MSLPEQPAPYRPSAPAENPWHWRLEAASGAEVPLSGADATEYADVAFPNQGDAESWIGEVWSDLAEQGVAAVTLFEHERLVYGPMSLSA